MKAQIASGVAWMVLFKLIDRGLGIVSTLILARLLVPADFGLVAMAMSVIAILELATSFSFEVALIQRGELQRFHYDTAWTLNVMLGLGCALLTALMAYPTALFYNEPRLTPVMLVLAVGWMFAGFENTGIVDFRRQLDFRRDFYFMAAKRVFAFALTLTLALTLRSYWALVIGSTAGRIFGVALSYWLHSFRPRPSLQAARELFGFSVWMLANNILSVVQSKVPHFAVGRLLGPQPLGLYAIGSEIAQIPTGDLIAPINRVLFPSYSRLVDASEQFRSTFLDVLSVTTLLVLPAAVGIAAVAHPLVLVMLGERWLDTVPVLQILALAAAVNVISAGNGPAYLALGQPRLITLVATVRVLVLVPLALVLTSQLGLAGAAWAELVTTTVSYFVSLLVLMRRLRLPARPYASRLWRPCIASAVMAYAVSRLLDGLPSAGSSFGAVPALALAVLTGIVTYFAAIGFLWLLAGRPAGAERLLLGRLMHWM